MLWLAKGGGFNVHALQVHTYGGPFDQSGTFLGNVIKQRIRRSGPQRVFPLPSSLTALSKTGRHMASTAGEVNLDRHRTPH